MSLILWLLATYGVADAISKARIGAPLRSLFPIKDPNSIELGHLLRCPKCVGFWAGMLLSLLRLGPASSLFPLPIAAPLNGFAASAWCWVVYVVLVRLGAEEL